jgi:hypothetical protein
MCVCVCVCVFVCLCVCTYVCVCVHNFLALSLLRSREPNRISSRTFTCNRSQKVCIGEISCSDALKFSSQKRTAFCLEFVFSYIFSCGI